MLAFSHSVFYMLYREYTLITRSNRYVCQSSGERVWLSIIPLNCLKLLSPSKFYAIFIVLHYSPCYIHLVRQLLLICCGLKNLQRIIIRDITLLMDSISHTIWLFLNVANSVFNKVYGFDIFRFAMHCFAMSIMLVPPILLTNVCGTRLNIWVASPDRFALQPWVRWIAHILNLSMVLSRYIFQNWKCFKTECYYDHCCMT